MEIHEKISTKYHNIYNYIKIQNVCKIMISAAMKSFVYKERKVHQSEMGLRKSPGSLVSADVGREGEREECVMNPDQLSRDQINRNYNIP